MLHNKMLYSPSQPLLFLTEARGSGWGLWPPGLVGASDRLGRTQGSVGSLWGSAAGFSEAPGVTGVSVLGTSLVFHVLWVSPVTWVPAVPGVPGVWRVAGVPWVWQACLGCGGRALGVTGVAGVMVSMVSRVSLVPWVPLVSGVSVA